MTQRQKLGDLLFVHWDETEARTLAASLHTLGWNVAIWKPALKLSQIRPDPPHALVISLRRLPSHGREVAEAVWSTRWGREIPIVFLDGSPDAVDATRGKFPTARFTTWEALPDLLQQMVVDDKRIGGL